MGSEVIKLRHKKYPSLVKAYAFREVEQSEVIDQKFVKVDTIKQFLSYNQGEWAWLPLDEYEPF